MAGEIGKFLQDPRTRREAFRIGTGLALRSLHKNRPANIPTSHPESAMPLTQPERVNEPVEPSLDLIEEGDMYDRTSKAMTDVIAGIMHLDRVVYHENQYGSITESIGVMILPMREHEVELVHYKYTEGEKTYDRSEMHFNLNADPGTAIVFDFDPIQGPRRFNGSFEFLPGGHWLSEEAQEQFEVDLDEAGFNKIDPQFCVEAIFHGIHEDGPSSKFFSDQIIPALKFDKFASFVQQWEIDYLNGEKTPQLDEGEWEWTDDVSVEEFFGEVPQASEDTPSIPVKATRSLGGIWQRGLQIAGVMGETLGVLSNRTGEEPVALTGDEFRSLFPGLSDEEDKEVLAGETYLALPEETDSGLDKQEAL